MNYSSPLTRKKSCVLFKNKPTRETTTTKNFSHSLPVARTKLNQTDFCDYSRFFFFFLCFLIR